MSEGKENPTGREDSRPAKYVGATVQQKLSMSFNSSMGGVD